MKPQVRGTIDDWQSLVISGCFWTSCCPSVAREPRSDPHAYSITAMVCVMTSRSEVLREVMLETGTTQSEPVPAQRCTPAEHQRLPLGQGRPQRQPARPAAVVHGLPARGRTPSGCPHADSLGTPLVAAAPAALDAPEPRELQGVAADDRAQPRPSQRRVTGQPHERNLDRWRQLVDRGDLPGLHRVLTGLDRDSIEMREVSPMSGLLPDEQRREILQLAG